MSHRIFHPENVVKNVVVGGLVHYKHHSDKNLVEGGSVLLQKGLGGVGSTYTSKSPTGSIGSGLSEKLKKLQIKQMGTGIKIKRKNIALQI